MSRQTVHQRVYLQSPHWCTSWLEPRSSKRIAKDWNGYAHLLSTTLGMRQNHDIQCRGHAEGEVGAVNMMNVSKYEVNCDLFNQVVGLWNASMSRLGRWVVIRDALFPHSAGKVPPSSWTIISHDEASIIHHQPSLTTIYSFRFAIISHHSLYVTINWPTHTSCSFWQAPQPPPRQTWCKRVGSPRAVASVVGSRGHHWSPQKVGNGQQRTSNGG